ncbi:uncharacterized protein LOC144129010 [Amblyomma americanum]
MEALPTVDGKRSAAPPRIFCDTCGALFPAQDLLEMHRSTMHPPRPQGRHRCAYCDFSRDSKMKKGFRNMKISMARGFGMRADPDTMFLLDNDDFDPMNYKSKRDIRRISLSTATGFGKRLSPGSSDEQPAATWLAEEVAKGDLNHGGALYQDTF